MNLRLNKKVAAFIKVNLGWEKFTDIQHKAIPKILEGNNVLIVSDTATGKTEAAMLPILNFLIGERLPGVRCVYFAPLKALINDITKRIHPIFKPFGIEVGRWHGDVPKSDKNYSLYNASILIITPESMESLLTSQNFPKSIFENIRFIVTDEIHNFASNPRGAQLVCLIERLQAYSKNEIQRISMSATVGNLDEVLQWYSGSSKRKSTVIYSSKKRSLAVKALSVEDEIDIIALIQHLQKNGARKTLVFADSRKQVEFYADKLKENNINAFPHHSSISKDIRETIEKMFKSRIENMVIVSTSTLELGIDIGDIDSVIFIGIPYSNSSFLQKVGRSGRKAKEKIAYFITGNNCNSLLRLLGISKMLKEDVVEAVHPLKYYPQLLGHQIISSSYERKCINKDVLLKLQKAKPFACIKRQDFKMLVDYLLENGFLFMDSKKQLVPGDQTNEILENGFKKKKFVVTFPGTIEYKVTYNNIEVGSLQPIFVEALSREMKATGRAVFTLANKSWKVLRIDDSRMRILVNKANEKQIPIWLSMGPRIDFDFAQAIRNALLSKKLDETVKASKVLTKRLKELFESESSTVCEKPIKIKKLMISNSSITEIFTYFGDLGNLLFCILLNLIGIEKTKRNWRQIQFKSDIDPEDLIDDIKLLLLNRENLSRNIAHYLLESPLTMKYVYYQLGDTLRKYANNYLVAKSLAEFLIDERVINKIMLQ